MNRRKILTGALALIFALATPKPLLSWTHGVQAGTALAFKNYSTTGTISGASNSLVVSSNPGFQIGDAIIVETGGEAGLGARGTKGVGGTWPTLSYANAAAMNADTSKPDGQHAWLLDTGDVYFWLVSLGVWLCPTIITGPRQFRRH